jgi:hypothetical protein
MNRKSKNTCPPCPNDGKITRLEESLLKCAETNTKLTTTVSMFISHQTKFNDEFKHTQEKLNDDIYGYMRDSSARISDHDTQIAVIKSSLNWLPLMIFLAVVAAQFLPQIPEWLQNILSNLPLK